MPTSPTSRVTFIKRIPLIAMAAMCFCMSTLFSGSAYASAGFWKQFVIIDTGSGNVYRGNPLSSNFEGVNLGTFCPTDTFILNGGEANTFQNSGDDVNCNNFCPRMGYRIRLQSGSASFTLVPLSFVSISGSDKKWDKTNLGVNILSGLAAGNYYLEVYFEGNATYTGGNFNFNDNNGGANYKATFTVRAAPAISSSTGDQTVCSGSPATYSVTATGDNITYQWRKGGATLSNNATISGATSATLTVTPTSSADNVTTTTGYDCVVSGTCTPTQTSTRRALTVNNAVSISGNPSDPGPCIGANATFTVTASGTGLSYSWRKSGTAIANGPTGNGSTYGGQGTPTLTISNVQAADGVVQASGFDCVVSGTAPCTSQTSSKAALTVVANPTVSNPSNQSACIPPGTATFTVTGTGVSTGYQWFQVGNGTPLSAGGTITSVGTAAGTSSSLVLGSLITGNSGAQFYCVATGCGGAQATSGNATLTVSAASTAPTSASASSTTICSGSSTTLSITGGSAGTGATLKWYSGSCGGTLVGTGNNLSVSPTSTTTYYARYEDPAPCNTLTACASVTVTVNTASTAPTSASASSTTICSGNSTTLSITGGSAGTGATLKWYSGSCGGTLVGNGNNLSVSPTSTTTYYARYEDPAPCSTLTACASVTVTVNTAAGISTPPSNQSACSGSTATFTVTASGTTPSFAWRKRDSSAGWGTGRAWSFTSTDGSFFLQTSAQNNDGGASCTASGYGSDINTNGVAWGMYGGTTGGNGASAARTFPNALATGQYFKIDMDNGSVDTGKLNGFSLKDSSGTTRLRFYFKGGDSNYYYDDNSGTLRNTSIGFTRNGLTIKVTITGADTYAMTVTPCGGSTSSFSGTLLTGTAIDRVTLFNNNTTGGDKYNLYWNSMIAGAATDDAGSNYSNWSTGNNYGIAPISGATSSSYTTGTLGTGDNNTSYDVVVWNSCDNLTFSSAATLTVNSIPATPGAITQGNPSGTAVCANSTGVTYTISAVSGATTYTWTVPTGGTIQSGQGTTSITVNYSSASAGSVTVTAGNTCGTSSAASLSISVTSAPTVSADPQNTTVCSGSTANFSVTANNATGYQWQFSTDNGGTWNNVSGGTGATTASYTTATTTTAMNGYQYRCVVSGACTPNATSNPATLTVTPAVNITGQPSGATKCVGDSVTFTITASNASGYQWKKGTPGSGTIISGATGNSYTINPIAGGDAGSYYCTVSGNSPCAAVDSSAATLTVNTAPLVTAQPQPQTACAGGYATFTATASNATGYQWKKGTPGSGTTISGATSASYTIGPVAAGDAGNYYCTVSGSAPCASVDSSAAALTVNGLPSISAQPAATVTACQNSTANFSVTASGSGVSYQWRKRNAGWAAGWVLTPNIDTADKGFFVANSVINNANGDTNGDADISTGSGRNKAFGIFAKNGNGAADAVRVASTALAVGETIQVDIDNGQLNLAAGSVAGLTLRAGASTDRFEFYASESSGTYKITDSTGVGAVDTGMALSTQGVRILFTLTAANTYSVTATKLSDGTVYTRSATLANSGSIDRIRLFFYNPTATSNSNTDFYFNSVKFGNATDDASDSVYNTGAGRPDLQNGDNGGGLNLTDGSTGNGSTYAGVTTSAFSITTVQPADAASYDVLIGGTCRPAITSSASALTVNNQPVITTTSLPNGTIGTMYSTSLTSGSGTSPYSYAVTTGTLPAGLSMSSAGAFSGTPTASAPGGVSSFTVTVTDANGCTNTKNLSITVSCPTITLTPSVPNATINAPYDQTVSALSGNAPFTYAVTSGTLPTGLSLTPSGANAGKISGTPTVLESQTFTITATDNKGCTGSQSYTIQVQNCPAITLTASLPNVNAGTAYNQTVSASGGSGSYSYAVTSGSLPPGLSLNGSSGAITGTPNLQGTYNFTITATDTATSCFGSQAYTIQVQCGGAITLSPVSLPGGTTGVAYSQTITASGGSGTYTFTTSSTLPTGITLASGGSLSGTPTQSGSFSITVVATDAYGCTGSKVYSLVISCVGITVNVTGAPAGAICAGTGISLTANPTGGASPYTYSWTKDGSAFATTQTINDTPSSTGSPHTYVATATDANGCSANSSTISVTVNTAPAITAQPAGLTRCEGTSASFAVTATGTAPLSYAWRKRGSGWGTGNGWAFNTSGANSGFFISSSAENGNGASGHIDTSGKAWGLYANSGDTSAAVRNFPSAMAAGQTLKIDMDNGDVQTGGTVGFGVQNSASENLVQVYFVGGQSNYKIDNGSVTDTGVGFTANGLHIEITLTSATAYSIAITPAGGSTSTLTGNLASPAGGQAIAKVRLFNFNAGPNNSRNLFFNSISLAGADDSAAGYNSTSGNWTVTVGGGNNGGQTALSNGGGISGATSSTLTVNPVALSHAGAYDVYVANSCGSVISSAASLTVNALPTATVSGDATICAGNSTTIQAILTGTGPWSVTWSDGATQNNVAASPATRSVSPSGNITYTVTSVSDANCTGTSSGSAAVTVITVGPAGAITGPSTACPNQVGAVYSIAAVSGAATYNWTVPSGATITAGSGTTSITVDFGTSSGNVTVTPVNGSCSGTVSGLAVTVSGSPTVTATSNAPYFGTPTASYQIVQGQTLNLSASTVGGAISYSWTRNGSSFTGNSGQNVSDTPSPGSYTYAVTVPTSCGTAVGSTALITVLASTTGTIPDSWKSAHGYNDPNTPESTQGANLLTLLQSYLAGVDPTCATCKLEFDSVAVNNSGMVTLTWNSQQDGTTPERKYDVYAATGEFATMTGATKIQANVSRSGNATSYQDNAAAATFKYYRVTIAGTTQVVTPEVAGVQKMTLSMSPNVNYISMALPAGVNTLANVLGTDQLPAGTDEATATVVQIWNQNEQVFVSSTTTQRYWLSSAVGYPGWRRSGDWADANSESLDPNKGMSVTIRSGTPTLRIAGFVPTANEQQTVADGSQTGSGSAGSYTLASSTFPKSVSLANSGLLTSGFTGGISLARSDSLLFWNAATKQWDIRVWYNTSSSQWLNANGTATTRQLVPGEAFLINRRTSRGSFLWTLPVPYTTPIAGP